MAFRPAATSHSHIRNILLAGMWNIGILSFVLNALLLIPSLFLIQVYDRVLPSQSLTTLIYLSLVTLGGLLFLGFLDIVRSIYMQRVATLMDRELGPRAFKTSLASSQDATSDIRGLRDLSSVRNFVASRGMANLFDLPFAPLFVLLLYFIHPVLSLLTTGGIVLMVALVWLNEVATRGMSTLAQEKAVQANLSAQAFVRSAETLRAMGMINNTMEAWGRHFAHSSALQNKMGGINAAFSGLSRASRMILQSVILGAGAYLILEGEMTAGMIFASSIISGRALQPIDQLIGNWKPAREAWRAWQRLLLQPKDDAVVSERLRLPEVQGGINVKNLTWSIPNRKGERATILKRLNFEIMPGESIAIVGPSGAGKTTLARLLAGALKPSDGSIFVDGAEYSTWDPKQIGEATGYLPQDVQLLPGSIAENIARFDLTRSDENVIKAAQKAQAHELIIGLPEGYQTFISATSSGLSGGMRQRIGLARAFYGTPRLLVLDEPNSNLDADGEEALERALAQAKSASITVIVVTHRPTTAQKRDKLMFLRNGVIEAFGPAKATLAALADIAKSRSNMEGKPKTTTENHAVAETIRRQQDASGVI